MRTIITTVLLISFVSLYAQKAQLNFGVGVGGILEEQFSAGRGQLYLGGQVLLSDRLSVGIELSHGGKLLPVDGTGTFIDNLEVLEPYASLTNMAAVKSYYQIEKSFGFPFVALGGGLAVNKVFVHSTDTRDVKQSNFVGIAEAGVAFKNGLTTSIKYISKSDSPSFIGADSSGSMIRLDQASFSTLQITLGYRFDPFSK